MTPIPNTHPIPTPRTGRDDNDRRVGVTPWPPRRADGCYQPWPGLADRHGAESWTSAALRLIGAAMLSVAVCVTGATAVYVVVALVLDAMASGR